MLKTIEYFYWDDTKKPLALKKFKLLRLFTH